MVRLGMCGSRSTKAWMSINRIDNLLGQIRSAHNETLPKLAHSVDLLSTTRLAHNVMVLGDHVLVVWSQPGINPPLARLVAWADCFATAIDALTEGGARQTATVCLVDTDEEPRQLPGPSGRDITVTGLPWLAGIARQAILPGQQMLEELASQDDGRPLADGWTWPRLERQMRSAVQAASDLATPYLALMPNPSWWVVRQLQLDDGADEPLELVAVGPTGVFVLEPDRGAVAVAQERALRGAGRLHAYLPYADCIPIVVDQAAANTGVLTDAAGRMLCWWLPPDAIAAAVQRSPTRGVDPRTSAWLNAPLAGLRRSI
jgi:hypothetical protein